MKKITALLILGVLLFALCACGQKEIKAQISYAMGSPVSQTMYGGDEKVLDAALEAIKTLEDAISYRNPASEIALLNKEKTRTLSQSSLSLLEKSLKLSAETGGKYDITVLPLVKVWGFDTPFPSFPGKEAVAKAKSGVGYQNVIVEGAAVTLLNGAEIDLSAAGKGEACGVAVAEYQKARVRGGIVSVGGSVGIWGNKNGEKFAVALRDPFDTSSFIGTLYLTDTFVSTSGSYEKRFTHEGGVYHHLLDPKTGFPAESGLVSVTVVCADGGLSDMLATAFFCLGIEKSLPIAEKYAAEVIFITKEGKIYITPGLSESFDTPKERTVLS